jgi:type I restriction enzyme S subunit
MEFYKETQLEKRNIGFLPKSWKAIKIDDICKVRRGASPRPIGDKSYFSDKGRGWIRIEDVTSTYKFLRKTSQYLSEKGEKKSVPVKPGDLIMSICATIGKPIILDMKACIHDGFVWFSELSKEVDTEYMFYALQQIEDEFISKKQTGTQGNLNTLIVGRTTIPLPPLGEQKQIAAFFFKIDDLIQKTEEMIQKTQELKKGLMQELLTKGIGHKEFKYSKELGYEIPKEWEILELGEILSLEYGDGLTEKQRKEGKYPVYGSNGIIGYHSDYLVKGPGIIVGRKGTIGAVTWTDDCFWPIDTTYYVAPKNSKADLKWLFYKLKSMDLFELNMATGVPGLNRELAYSMNIALPPIHEQQKINSILMNVDNKINQEKNTKLQLEALKKGLMQVLLTGQVRIKVD